MRLVAVQTGLSPLSVLGGTVTDREFLTRVADRGVDVHLLVEAGEPAVEHRNLTPHRWRRRIRKRLPYVGNMDVALDLRALLRRLPPVDWIRFNSPTSVGIGTWAGSGGHRLWASYLHLEREPFHRFVDSWLPGRCELVTCLSEDTRRDLVARCPAADRPSTIVVPMGIDADRVASAGRPREVVRGELGVSSAEVLVLFVGVLTPRKGIGDLVRAWRRLGPRPDLRLLFVSKPAAEVETAMVRQLVAEDPRVRHLPGVPYERVAEYFRAADVFFFPTHLEGFGIVVGEAMAAGLPVVTTRAKGVRGVVADGETAFCAEIGDADAMADGLARLADSGELRRRLGDAGRRRIREHFSWEEKIDRLMAALEAAPPAPGRDRAPGAVPARSADPPEVS